MRTATARPGFDTTCSYAACGGSPRQTAALDQTLVSRQHLCRRGAWRARSAAPGRPALRRPVRELLGHRAGAVAALGGHLRRALSMSTSPATSTLLRLRAGGRSCTAAAPHPPGRHEHRRTARCASRPRVRRRYRSATGGPASERRRIDRGPGYHRRRPSSGRQPCSEGITTWPSAARTFHSDLRTPAHSCREHWLGCGRLEDRLRSEETTAGRGRGHRPPQLPRPRRSGDAPADGDPTAPPRAASDHPRPVAGKSGDQGR
jgi:hypothetical protein